MHDSRASGNIKRRAYSLPIIITLFVLVILLAQGTWGVWHKERESAGLVAGLRESTANLESRRVELEANIMMLETQEGVEEEIRERFDVVAEGEHLVVIVEPKEPEGPLEDEGRPWYKRLWGVIIGR